MKKLIPLFLSGVLLFGCDAATKLLKPDTGSKPGDLLIVIEEDIWKSPVGDSLRNYFEREFPGVPQPEMYFTVYKVFPNQFSKTFKQFHNILIVDVNPDLTESSIAKAKDEWANNQVVVRLSAPNFNGFMHTFKSRRAEISAIFHESDITRILSTLQRNGDAGVENLLADKFGASISIPPGYFMVVNDSSTFVTMYEGLKSKDGLEHQITRGVMMASFPYTSDSTFTKAYLSAKINALGMQYLWGEDSTSYVQIEPEYGVDSTGVALENTYAMEVRGLWTMHNEVMGGPFLCYAVLDAEKKNVHLVYGFIFAPQFDKRSFMLEMEALLRSYKHS